MNRKDKRFGCYPRCKNFHLLRRYAKLNNISVLPLPSGGRLKHIERRSFLNMRDLMRFSFSQNAGFSKWTFYTKVSLKNICTAVFKSLDETNNFLSLFFSIASFSTTQWKVTSFKYIGIDSRRWKVSLNLTQFNWTQIHCRHFLTKFVLCCFLLVLLL